MMKIGLAVLLAACGGKTEAPALDPGSAKAPPAGSGSAAPAATLQPCPAGDALEIKIAEVFELERKQLSQPSCLAGRFPKPSWLLQARFDNADGLVTIRTVQLDPAGAILHSEDDEIPPGAADSSGESGHQAIDFDHDGVDEILAVFDSDRRGYLTKTLVVRRFGTAPPLFERQVEYDNGAADVTPLVSCSATWKVDQEAGTIALAPSGKPSAECVEQPELWKLARGAAAFVQVKK